MALLFGRFCLALGALKHELQQDHLAAILEGNFALTCIAVASAFALKLLSERRVLSVIQCYRFVRTCLDMQICPLSSSVPC